MRRIPFQPIRVPIKLIPGRWLFLCPDHGIWQGRSQEGQCKRCYCLGKVGKPQKSPLFDTDPIQDAKPDYRFFTTKQKT